MYIIIKSRYDFEVYDINRLSDICVCEKEGIKIFFTPEEAEEYLNDRLLLGKIIELPLVKIA